MSNPTRFGRIQAHQAHPTCSAPISTEIMHPSPNSHWTVNNAITFLSSVSVHDHIFGRTTSNPHIYSWTHSHPAIFTASSCRINQRRGVDFFMWGFADEIKYSHFPWNESISKASHTLIAIWRELTWIINSCSNTSQVKCNVIRSKHLPKALWILIIMHMCPITWVWPPSRFKE